MSVKYLPKYFGTVIIVFAGSLHKAKTIYIAHVGLATSSQQVKPTYILLKGENKDQTS